MGKLTAKGAMSKSVLEPWSKWTFAQTYITMMNPRIPLKIAVQTMARGSVLEAFFNSSDIWVAASAPSNDVIGLIMPTRQARPTRRLSGRFEVIAETLEDRGESGGQYTVAPTALIAELSPDLMA